MARSGTGATRLSTTRANLREQVVSSPPRAGEPPGWPILSSIRRSPVEPGSPVARRRSRGRSAGSRPAISPCSSQEERCRCRSRSSSSGRWDRRSVRPRSRPVRWPPIGVALTGGVPADGLSAGRTGRRARAGGTRGDQLRGSHRAGRDPDVAGARGLRARDRDGRRRERAGGGTGSRGVPARTAAGPGRRDRLPQCVARRRRLGRHDAARRRPALRPRIRAGARVRGDPDARRARLAVFRARAVPDADDLARAPTPSATPNAARP